MRLTQLFFLLFLLLLFACSSVQKRSAHEIVLLDHGAFRIEYDLRHKLARLVTYDLRAEQLKMRTFKRKDRFVPDPILESKKIEAISTRDYTRTGYDRGHLAPAADFSWSEKALASSFYMSNIAPQSPGLNRDAWRRLEEKVRRWACGEKWVTVITGPVLSDTDPVLKNGLRIPQSFFKVIIDQTPPKKAVGFVYHQTDRGDLISKRQSPIPQIEALTKLTLLDQSEGRDRLPARAEEWKEEDCR